MRGTHEMVQPAAESQLPPILGPMRHMADTVARSFDLEGPVFVVAREPQSSRYIVAIGIVSVSTSSGSPDKASKSVVFQDVFESIDQATGSQVVDTLVILSNRSKAPIICDHDTTEEVMQNDRSVEFHEDKRHRLMGRQGRKYYYFAA